MGTFVTNFKLEKRQRDFSSAAFLVALFFPDMWGHLVVLRARIELKPILKNYYNHNLKL